jgi:hypothetical protein
MNILQNPAVIAQLRELSVDPARIRRVQPFSYSLDWSGITNGATGVATVRIDNGAPFLVTRTGFRAWLGAAFGGAVIGSTLPRNGTEATSSGLTMPSIDTLRLELSDQNGSWQDKPVRAANWAGTDENELASAPRVIGGGVTVNGLLGFDTGVAANISAQLTFRGFRLFP